jgi:hyperosmotically inducible periplasmic protein
MRLNDMGVALFLAAALVSGACSRPATPDPSKTTEQALKDAKLDKVTVDWDKDAKVAHLKGTVDSAEDRRRAEEVASSAVGTSGRVLNEVTVEGSNERNADDFDSGIRTRLKNMISEDPVLKDRDIDFDVNNGVVTVKGDVRTAAEKSKVTDLVKAVPGVKDMANALEIKAQ